MNCEQFKTAFNKDRVNILRELGLMDGGDVINLNKDTIRNGIKYSLNTSKELGI